MNMATRLMLSAAMLLAASVLQAEPKHDHDSPTFRLLEAILHDDLQEAARLIAAGADPKLDPDGNCLALAPIAQNKPKTLRFLIERGADANCQAAKGLKQATLLGNAVELGRVEISRLLLTLGANPNKGSLVNQSFTPFIDALEQCGRRADRATSTHLLLIKEMINRGANVNSVWHEGERSESALNLAIRCPAEAVDTLLGAGANPNGPGSDAYGDQASPLGTAISRHSLQKVQLLLKAGADATTAEISNLAKSRNVPKEIVEVLRASGTRVSGTTK